MDKNKAQGGRNKQSMKRLKKYRKDLPVPEKFGGNVPY
jgi:hypothetical protein